MVSEKMNMLLQLSPGLYRVFWKNDDRSSLASLGVNAAGELWIAPTNWIQPAPLAGYVDEIDRMDRLDAQEPPKSPADCEHRNFVARPVVQRMEDTGAFMLEVRVACNECEEPFRFLGVPGGLNWERPTASVDGLELRAPIEPQGEPKLLTGPFEMPGAPPDKGKAN